MPPKIAPEVEHKVLAYLDLGMSPKVILMTLKKQNISIHRNMISNIKNRRENPTKVEKKWQKRKQKYTNSSTIGSPQENGR